MPGAKRWRRLTELFEKALDRPPDERDAFLRSECGGDTRLLLTVRSLLDANGEAHRFLESSAFQDAFIAPARQDGSRRQTTPDNESDSGDSS